METYQKANITEKQILTRDEFIHTFFLLSVDLMLVRSDNANRLIFCFFHFLPAVLNVITSVFIINVTTDIIVRRSERSVVKLAGLRQ